MPKFEYDTQKSRSNFRKHQITFKQAVLLWNGRYPLLIEEDDRLDYDERRFIATGLLPNLNCIVVAFTQRNRVIRIISARPAETAERDYYYERSGYTPSA